MDLKLYTGMLKYQIDMQTLLVILLMFNKHFEEKMRRPDALEL